MKNLFKNNPFLSSIVGEFPFSYVSLGSKGQLVAAIWIIILCRYLCLYLNHIKDKNSFQLIERISAIKIYDTMHAFAP